MKLNSVQDLFLAELRDLHNAQSEKHPPWRIGDAEGALENAC